MLASARPGRDGLRDNTSSALARSPNRSPFHVRTVPDASPTFKSSSDCLCVWFRHHNTRPQPHSDGNCPAEPGSLFSFPLSSCEMNEKVTHMGRSVRVRDKTGLLVGQHNFFSSSQNRANNHCPHVPVSLPRIFNTIRHEVNHPQCPLLSIVPLRNTVECTNKRGCCILPPRFVVAPETVRPHKLSVFPQLSVVRACDQPLCPF